MGSYTVNSPNVQPAGTPLSSFSPNSNFTSVQQSPVTSYVVPGNSEPIKVVNSPSASNSVSFGHSQSPNSGLNNSQTREISTVYLPPIRYRYDNATGTLIQISGNSPRVQQAQSPVNNAPQNFNQFNTPFVTYSPTLAQQTNPLSQNTHLLNQHPSGFASPQSPSNQGFRLPNFTSQPYVQAGPQTQPFVNPQFGGNNFGNHPGFGNPLGQFQAPQGQAFVNPQFRPSQPPFYNQPFQQSTAPVGSGRFGQAYTVPTFGNQPVMESGRFPGNFHNYNNNNMYMDTPRLRYEAAVKDYYDRMNGNFQNYNPPSESPNGFAQAFSAFENVASKFFSGTDGFVSDFKDVAFKILNPNSSDYLKAAVFKLQRLENVPVNPNSVSKLSFNVVAYFDPNTENYDIHKSEKQWALPTQTAGLVDCDLKGETLKVPWKGEEFVFLKILENVGPNRFVLGRLQLKLDSLVTGHPLKVTVIGDDGHPKGSAILEFGVGAFSAEEINEMNTKMFMKANHSGNNHQRSTSSMMPGYEAMLEEKNMMEWEGHSWPRTKLTSRSQKNQKGKSNLPAPLRFLVSWCCDITDRDLD